MCTLFVKVCLLLPLETIISTNFCLKWCLRALILVGIMTPVSNEGKE